MWSFWCTKTWGPCGVRPAVPDCLATGTPRPPSTPGCPRSSGPSRRGRTCPSAATGRPYRCGGGCSQWLAGTKKRSWRLGGSSAKMPRVREREREREREGEANTNLNRPTWLLALRLAWRDLDGWPTGAAGCGVEIEHDRRAQLDQQLHSIAFESRAT